MTAQNSEDLFGAASTARDTALMVMDGRKTTPAVRRMTVLAVHLQCVLSAYFANRTAVADERVEADDARVLEAEISGALARAIIGLAQQCSPVLRGRDDQLSEQEAAAYWITQVAARVAQIQAAGQNPIGMLSSCDDGSVALRVLGTN